MPLWIKRNFSIEQIPDLSGKIAIVTGSNTGIGQESALELARKNCTVILACRNSEKTLEVVKEIQEETGNKKVEFIKLDLTSLKSVKAFSEEFKSRYDQLHILMNNAGVMMVPYGLTEDGIETHFATNHVAHFYLTTLLLPELKRSAPSRIVIVASEGHVHPFGELDLEHISDCETFSGFSQYGKSKACNVLFARELAKRLEDKGIKIYVNSIHPGIVRSDIARHVFNPRSLFFIFLFKIFAYTTKDGALTQLYAATSPEIEEKNYYGQYFVPLGNLGKARGIAASENAPKEVWDFTENLLAEKIPDYERVTI